MKFKKERLEKLIRELTSKNLIKLGGVEDALATVTKVEIDKNLENAVIKISVWPKEREKEALKKLKDFRHPLQLILNKEIKIKSMPRIDFEIDPGFEKAAKIEKIFVEEK